MGRRRMPQLGDAVRTARQARGLSQQELADAIGVHKGTISNLERGRVDTDSATIRRIEDSLGVELNGRALFRDQLVRVAQDAAAMELWSDDPTVRYHAAERFLSAFGYLGGWSEDPDALSSELEERVREIPGASEDHVRAVKALLDC